MPVSFWIFLIVCFVSFILVIKDHDEAWKEYRESKGNARYKKGVHLFALWFVPFFSLIGTLFLGFESFKSDEKDIQRDTQFRDVTNRLLQTESKYDEATNDLKTAMAIANDTQAKLKATSNALTQAQEATSKARAIAETAGKREIPDEVKQEAAPYLKLFPNALVEIDAIDGDSEAEHFAHNFVDFLNENRWKASFNGVLRIDREVTGIEIIVHSGADKQKANLLNAIFAVQKFQPNSFYWA